MNAPLRKERKERKESAINSPVHRAAAHTCDYCGQLLLERRNRFVLILNRTELQLHVGCLMSLGADLLQTSDEFLRGKPCETEIHEMNNLPSREVL